MAGKRGLRACAVICHAVVLPIACLLNVVSVANMAAGNTSRWAAYVVLPFGIILTLLYGVLASSIWLERISRREQREWQERECRLRGELHQMLDTTSQLITRMPTRGTD